MDLVRYNTYRDAQIRLDTEIVDRENHIAGLTLNDQTKWKMIESLNDEFKNKRNFVTSLFEDHINEALPEGNEDEETVPLVISRVQNHFTSFETLLAVFSIILELYFCYSRYLSLNDFTSQFVLFALTVSIIVLKTMVISQVKNDFKDISSILKAEQGLKAKSFLFVIHWSFTLMVAFIILNKDQSNEVKFIKLLASLGLFLVLYFPLSNKYNARHHYTSIGMGVAGSLIVTIENLVIGYNVPLVGTLFACCAIFLFLHIWLKRTSYLNIAVIFEVIFFEGLILLLLV
jgi:hypothetical protein